MTQVYTEAGEVIPVTVIEAGPCHVLQVKTVDRDGYEAVQVGFEDKPRPQGNRKRQSQASRSERGHVAAISSKRSQGRQAAGVELLPKADCEPKKMVRELRGSVGDAAVGQVIDVNVLEGVTSVDVTGVCKGRGYAGTMVRHNFSGQRATHGVKKCHRHPGGTSAATFPARTMKGRKMAGQYGNVRTTVRNLKVVRIDVENSLLLVRGAVPGPVGGYVTVRETNKVG
ncbi:MAG: 50S ribosomal protein L3 [Pirellulaceae bacterium]